MWQKWQRATYTSKEKKENDLSLLFDNWLYLHKCLQIVLSVEMWKSFVELLGKGMFNLETVSLILIIEHLPLLIL